MGGPVGPVGGAIVMGTFPGDGWEAIKDHLSAVSRDVGPRVVANTWFAHNEDIDEATLLADIPVAASVGVEVYTIDAGWYSKPGLKFGSDGLGTWQVDQTKFPRGLVPVMDSQIHAQGMLPGLCFEPERAWKGSSLWKEHRRWPLRDGITDQALVDFGNPEVQRWAIELISTAIEQYGLGWIKWDFNMDPAPVWQGSAALEMAHVRGVYTVMEQLRGRHPDVGLEKCASGGNRIDGEMIRRADVYWLSDQTTQTDGQRFQSASAAMVLPARYRYTAMAQKLGTRNSRRGQRVSRESWLTVMSGTFGIMNRLPGGQVGAPAGARGSRGTGRSTPARRQCPSPSR